MPEREGGCIDGVPHFWGRHACMNCGLSVSEPVISGVAASDESSTSGPEAT